MGDTYQLDIRDAVGVADDEAIVQLSLHLTSACLELHQSINIMAKSWSYIGNSNTLLGNVHVSFS